MALLNEKPGVNVETTDPDDIIRQLRIAYKCNCLDYAGRYSRAVKALCKKYKVRIAEMNRMIAEDPAMAKEVYAVMDAGSRRMWQGGNQSYQKGCKRFIRIDDY